MRYEPFSLSSTSIRTDTTRSNGRAPGRKYSVSVQPLLQQLLDAPTWEATRQLVEQHPALLAAEVDTALSEMLGRLQPGSSEYQCLIDLQQLLGLCRVAGIDAAFQDLLSSPPLQVPEILNLLNQLAQPQAMPRRALLLRFAMGVVERRTQPKLWSVLADDLAKCLMATPFGDGRANREQAISLLEDALAVQQQCAPGSTSWAETAVNLAAVYHETVNEQKVEGIERAIRLYEQAIPALAIELRGPAKRNLARAYSERLRCDRAENLQHAYELGEEVLRLPAVRESKSELALTYQLLAQLTYDVALPGDRTQLLEQSLVFARQAHGLAASVALPKDKAAICLTLGIALLKRTRGVRQENLRQAEAAFLEVLEGYDRYTLPRAWGQAQTNIATTYLYWQDDDRAEKLEQALLACQQALKVRTRELVPMEWAATMHILGEVYSWRIRGERADNLERSIAAFEAALEVRSSETTPVAWLDTISGLAGAYRDRRNGVRSESLRRCVELYVRGIRETQAEVLPFQHRQLHSDLGRLLFYLEQWQGAVYAFAKARRIGDLLYARSATVEGRQAELGQVQDILTRAVYSLAKLGRLGEAVELLESSRARLLNEILGRNRDRLGDLSESEKERYRQALRLVEEKEAAAQAVPTSDADRFVHASTELRAAHEELLEVAEQCRIGPGEPLDAQSIVAIAQQAQRPIVYLLTTPHGSLALIVSHHEADEPIVPVWLDDFSTFDIRRLMGVRSRPLDLSTPVEARYLGGPRSFLRAIWSRLRQQLMAPVVDRLFAAGESELILIPCGHLGLLPLQAVEIDRVAVSVVPSARVLAQALNRANAVAHSPASLLAVANPTGDLAWTTTEVQAITAHFEEERCQMLCGESATISALCAAEPASYLHLACHGTYDEKDPMASALVLAGRECLSLEALLAHRLDLSQTRLAVLSACKSVVFDMKGVPDEMIGLPAGLLSAGVPGVVGTQWSVADLSTALLMIRFYQLLRVGSAQPVAESLTPAQALRAAQRWLRDATLDDLSALTQTCAPEISSQLHHRELSCEVEPDGIDLSRPYQDPYYWSGFVFLGA